MDGRKPDHRYTISSPMSLWLRLAKNLSSYQISDIETREIRQHQRINGPVNGPVNAHLTSWPSKVQNIQNLENIW